MGNELLSLLEITARRGTDASVGLVEEIGIVAPELTRVMGRSIPGTSYLARVRTALPSNAGFRGANEGVFTSASKIEQRRFSCFFWDCQLRVDEAVVIAANAEGDSMEQVLSEEAVAVGKMRAINCGKQFYMGTTNDSKGCPGLVDFLTTQQAITDPLTSAAIDQEVTAGGSASGKCERVWYAKIGLDGVHWLWGGNQGILLSPWTKQQVVDPNAATKSFMAYVANESGYLGLSCANPRAVGCIENVDNTWSGTAFTKPWTDAMSARLWAKFPADMKPNIIFASRASVAGLQASRTVTIQANAGQRTAGVGGNAGTIAPRPTEDINGVPIVETDSIPLSNAT